MPAYITLLCITVKEISRLLNLTLLLLFNIHLLINITLLHINVNVIRRLFNLITFI